MKYLFKYIVLFVVVLSSCDATIHEYPKEISSEIVLKFKVDNEPIPHYKDVLYGYNGLISRAGGNNLYRRYILEIYNVSKSNFYDKGNRVLRKEIKQVVKKDLEYETFKVSLPVGRYRVVSWVDYSLKDDLQDWYYKTANFGEITEDRAVVLTSNELKESFSKNLYIDVRRDNSNGEFYILDEQNNRYAKQADINVVDFIISRANAKFSLLANDVEEYKAAGGKLENLRIKIKYTQFLSDGFSAFSQSPNKFIDEYTIVRPIDERLLINEKELHLMSDFILSSSGKEDIVKVDISIYNKNDVLLNIYQDIEVPLYRTKETVVRGPFLTRNKEKGGVGIDDDFENEHVINID